MQETFLHFIWQFQYFNKSLLRTAEGQSLHITKPGILNNDAGPDFFNASVVINAVQWYGSVEVHIKSSDWEKHKHITDPAYNKVILHVVWEYDQPTFRPDQTLIPTLELKDRINTDIISRYENLIKSKSAIPIPCSNLLEKVKPISFLNMVESSAMYRLHTKALYVRELLYRNKENWEETTYQLLSKNFGFKLNDEPFLHLSRSIPLNFLAKHRHQIFQMEALLFGQAGFLQCENEDSYFIELRNEYSFLSKKYRLEKKQLPNHPWKFMRMRPLGFPTIRIAQLAKLLASQENIFSLFRDSTSYEQLARALKIKQSEYWQEHYQFGKKIGKGNISGLGKSSINNLIINTVVPLLFAYGKIRNENEHEEYALALLQQIPPENNKIIRLWKTLGKFPDSAFESQGMIGLYNHFCLEKKCISCKVGVEILKDRNKS